MHQLWQWQWLFFIHLYLLQLRKGYRINYETYSKATVCLTVTIRCCRKCLNTWWHTHPSFSNSPLQSTTGPPLPMRSRVCKLTGNKQVVEFREMKERKVMQRVICTDNVLKCVQPYLQSAPELRHCLRDSAYIDQDAGLEEEDKGNAFNPKAFLLSMYAFFSI